MSTPIEEARNLGPASGVALRAVGIPTLEALSVVGWQQAFEAVVAYAPIRCNLAMAKSLIGAVEGLDWHYLPTSLQEEAQWLVTYLRRGRKPR